MKSNLTFLFIFCTLILISCNRHTMQINKYEKKRNKLAYTDSSLIVKRNNGIDFIAQGDIPLPWKLEMDFDNYYIFKTANDTVRCAPANNFTIQNPKAEQFKAVGVHKTLDITIADANCENSKQKITTVLVGDILFKGCGEFLYNHQLHNKWTLIQIDNEELDDNEFPFEHPFLQLDLSKLKMIGFDGCNGISSAISIYGDRIKFSNITSTLKACINVRSDKMKLALLSDQLIEYRFRNNNLVLYLIDDSRLVFKPEY